MPLPDYSRSKADLQKKKEQKSSLAADLCNLPLANMDEEARRRRSSGAIGYDMGFDLEIAAKGELSDGNLENSMTSLADPFYDEEEEVTDSYEEEEESCRNLNDSTPSIRSNLSGRRHTLGYRSRKDDGMSKSVSDASMGRMFPQNTRRSVPSDFEFQKSDGSLDSSSKKSEGKLGDFLDKKNKKGRKKTELLPGSTTDDLLSEMNEVVSMLSAKRRPHQPFPQNTSRGTSNRLKDYSAPAGGSRRPPSKSPGPPQRRTPQRTKSHDRGLRRCQSAEEDQQPPRGSRRLPPKSKSHDGTSKRPLTRTKSSDKVHTHNSFVTGSRIRRIQPGGLGNSSSNLSGDSSFRAQQRRGMSPASLGGRSCSPKRRTKDSSSKSPKRRTKDKNGKKTSDNEVPPLLLS